MLRHLLILILAFCLLPAAAAVPAAAAGGAAVPFQGQIFYGTVESTTSLDNIFFTDTSTHWAKDPIVRMAGQGLIRGYGNGVFRPEAPVSKEETLALLVRAFGWEAEAEKPVKKNMRAGSRSAAQGAETKLRWSDGYLAAAVTKKIITADEEAKLETARQEAAQRQEVALWLGRALGLNPVLGTAMHRIFAFKDASLFAGPELGTVEAVLQSGLMGGVSPEAFDPRGPMKRGQMAALLDRIPPEQAAGRGVMVAEGEVQADQEEGSPGAEGKTAPRVYPVLLSTGKLVYLAAGSDKDPAGGARDFAVYKDGALGLSGLLTKGDSVRLTLRPEGAVSLVEVVPVLKAEAFGLIQKVDGDGGTVQIIDAGDKRQTYKLHPETRVSIGGREAGLSAILPGQAAWLTLRNGQAVEIKLAADLSSAPFPGLRTVTGRVLVIGVNEVQVSGDSIGSARYPLAGDLSIVKNGMPTDWADVLPGEEVRLFLNGAKNEVTQLEVISPLPEIRRVIRGRIVRVNFLNRQVTLSDTTVFQYGVWVKSNMVITLDVDPDGAIFLGRQPVDLKGLGAAATGMVVYAALSAPFDHEVAVKLLVPAGGETSSNRQLERFNPAQNSLSLTGETSQVPVGPEAIVVSNGRLGEPGLLKAGRQVFIAHYTQGSYSRAGLIVQQDTHDGRLAVFQGGIAKASYQDFRLNKYAMLEENSWSKPSGANGYVSFNLTSETVIRDAVAGGNQDLSLLEFLRNVNAGKYALAEATVVAREGDALSVTLRPPPGTARRSSLGQVKEIDPLAGQITLSGMQDWSVVYRQWVANAAPTTLDTASAVVVREAAVGAADNLQAAQEVFVVHDLNEALLVFILD